GVIEKLTQRRVVQHFDVLSYPEGSAYYARYKKKMAASAVVWAASGSGGTASALLQDYDRALCGAWYLTGRINGRRFTGWLGYHWCYEGEEVELLAAPVGEEYLVYAIHKPEEQSLCMTPGCYRGKNQARRAAVRIPLRVCCLCFAISIAALLCGDGLASFYDPMFYLFIVEAIIFLLVMCLLPAAWSIYKHKPLPEETLSEEIFTLLGWENVTDINLVTLHKRRKKEWKRTGIPPNPLRKGTPFDHSGIRAGIFYY
ncbi:putative type VI secretion system effector, partial [Citrobacter freundii]|uniref:putative type VI secretion system effector n=1 Tax=Citrobacter freundii TaxID=546 RepID=UPI00397B280B